MFRTILCLSSMLLLTVASEGRSEGPAAGLEVSLDGPHVWATPLPNGRTDLSLHLKIVNRTGVDIQVDSRCILTARIKDASGVEPPGQTETTMEKAENPAYVKLAPGEALRREIPVIVRHLANGKLQISVQESPETWLECRDLPPGKYSIGFALPQEPSPGPSSGAVLFAGKASSNRLDFTIADERRAASPPAAGDGHPAAGLEISLNGPHFWATPLPNGLTKLSLGLKIVNRTGADVQIDSGCTLTARIKDASGVEPPGQIDETMEREHLAAYVKLAPGEALRREIPVIVRPLANGKLQIGLQESPETWFQCSDLPPGKYSIGFTLQPEPSLNQQLLPGAVLFAGRASSNRLDFAFTDEFAEASPPAAKENLSISALLPKKRFADDEPLEFTVRFKAVGDKPVAVQPDAVSRWQIRVSEVKQDGLGASWRVRFGSRSAGERPYAELLEAGGCLNLSVALDPRSGRFKYEPTAGVGAPPVSRLPAGRYNLTVECPLGKEPHRSAFEPYWVTGTVVTLPVTVEVGGQ